MLEITLAIPDEVINDFTNYHHYQELLPDADGELTVPNPVTRDDFLQQTVARFVNESVKAWRVDTAVDIAKATEVAAIDAVTVKDK